MTEATTTSLPANQPAAGATGPVRMVYGPDDFGTVLPGDVLVAPATAPAWTPLFSRFAAVVTDGGTAAAHASLIAREYGIPAVCRHRSSHHPAAQRASSLSIKAGSGRSTSKLRWP